jgi:hypothetical protein
METVLELGHDLNLAEDALVVAVENATERGKGSDSEAFGVVKNPTPAPLAMRS